MRRYVAEPVEGGYRLERPVTSQTGEGKGVPQKAPGPPKSAVEADRPATKADLQAAVQEIIWPPKFMRDPQITAMQRLMQEYNSVTADPKYAQNPSAALLRMADISQQFHTAQKKMFNPADGGPQQQQQTGAGLGSDAIDYMNNTDLADTLSDSWEWVKGWFNAGRNAMAGYSALNALGFANTLWSMMPPIRTPPMGPVTGNEYPDDPGATVGSDLFNAVAPAMASSIIQGSLSGLSPVGAALASTVAPAMWNMYSQRDRSEQLRKLRWYAIQKAREEGQLRDLASKHGYQKTSMNAPAVMVQPSAGPKALVRPHPARHWFIPPSHKVRRLVRHQAHARRRRGRRR